MKLKIKVKVLTEGCMPEINPKGDWIDLRSAVDMEIPAPQSGTLKKTTINGEEVSHRDVEIPVYYIPLGVAIKLPEGFEAPIDSRSSGPKKMNIFIPNGQGIVDNSYSGNKDEWNYICSPMKATSIKKGGRICQFRIQLSQKATMWQKIKWLLSSGVELVQVDDLGDNNRGGLGSTGIK
jgi:dUTP pyrophosphatase